MLTVAGCLILALLPLALVGLIADDGPRATAVVYGGCLAMAAALFLLSLVALLDPGAPNVLVLPLGLPWLGMHLRLDALTAFFMLVVNLGAVLVSLYALGYGKGESAPRRVLPFVPAFLAGMNLVLLADDAFTFLLSWEFMSLTSWALVLREHENPQAREGAYLYLVMASLGTASLLLCFGLLAGPGGAYDFASIRARGPADYSQPLVLLLAVLGAGSKAGLVPLHVWLPPAHAAAPSHVSALMSGVMTKVAVYAAMRLLLDLAGPPAWWWGAVLMAMGAISAVLGLLYALMQADLKRFLAYSTVENLGIIYIALGFALAFTASGLPAAAAIALSAALLHALNHTLFKSLLFMGAGAVLHATHERDMDRLGGLIHRLPVTSACFLVGAAAISALPPLNGFVSEWLLFQAVLVSPGLPEGILRFLAPAVGAMMALAAALAAACFVRAYGITFLGRPRSEAARAAHEVDRFSLAAMARGSGAVHPDRHLPGSGDRPCRAGGGRGQWRRDPAGARRPGLALAGPDRRDPQLLQRPHPARVHRDLGDADGRLRPPLRLAGDAQGPGLGLRLPRSEPAHAVFGQQHGTAAAPGVRRDPVSAPATRSTCRGPARSGRRGLR